MTPSRRAAIAVGSRTASVGMGAGGQFHIHAKEQAWPMTMLSPRQRDLASI
jgi:hypothetical protein